jgi:hypothetical protein
MRQISLFLTFLLLPGVLSAQTRLWPAPRASVTRMMRNPGGPRWVDLGSTIVVETRGNSEQPGIGSITPVTISAKDEHLLAVFTKEPWEHVTSIPGLRVVARERGVGIVAVDRAAEAALERAANHSLKVGPVPWGKTLLIKSGGQPPAPPDPAVTTILSEVKPDEVLADIQHLVDFKSRYSTASTYHDAAAWAARKFASFGLKVERPTFEMSGRTSENVVASLEGTANTSETYLIGGHLDSISFSDVANAPGADDNASGSATVLAIAQVFARHRPRANLKFLLFGGEEEGLLGSAAYVNSLDEAARAAIKGVITLDMTGFHRQPEAGLMLEGKEISAPLTAAVARAAATYTTLKVERTLDAWGSDHMSFLDAGIPALLTFELEYPSNGHQHGPRDLMSIVDINQVVAITKADIAALIELAGPVGSPRSAAGK